MQSVPKVNDKVRNTHEDIFQKGNEIFSKIVLGILHLTHKGYLSVFFLFGGLSRGFLSVFCPDTDFFHCKSSSVRFNILSDSDQNLSIGFREKCQQTLENGLKLQNKQRNKRNA